MDFKKIFQRKTKSILILAVLITAIFSFSFLKSLINFNSGAIAQAPANTPVLFFSDLESGPRIGNTDGAGGLTSADHGTIVTIWGKNLGSIQGTSKVYVNGAEAAYVYYWENADPETGDSGPADLYKYHGMQEIAFSIPSAAIDGLGEIYVTVDGQQSNSLPFTVRSGNIYFVKTTGSDTTGDGSWDSPWETIPYTVTQIQPGDIVYIADGVSQTVVTSYGACVNLGSHGSEGNPKSLVSYPGSTVTVGSESISRAFHNWVTGGVGGYGGKYWTIAKLVIRSASSGAPGETGQRIVGNYFTGPGNGQTGIIEGTGNSWKIIGNEFDDVGDPEGTKLYHVVYVSGIRQSSGPRSPTERDREIAWNYFHDCKCNRAINIYSEQSYSAFIEEHKVHDNYIINQRGDGILIGYYVTGENWVYNNVIINAGLGPDWYDGISSHSGIRISAGHSETSTVIHIYNNFLYGNGDTNAYPNSYGQTMIEQSALDRATIHFKNNLIYSIDSSDPYEAGWGGTPSIGEYYNLWYGQGSPPTWDTYAINTDPQFVNPSASDFHLQSTSPARNAGTSDVSSIVLRDFEGITRPQGSAYDIGAYEYMSGTTIKTCSQQNGYICSQTETCSGQWLTASDTGRCCSVECISEEVPNISLTKQVDPVKSPDGDLGAGQSQAQEGETLTYTLTYQNTSSVEARNIIITDNIPEETTYIEGSVTNGGVYNSGANQITWTISSLAGGGSGVVSFKVKVGEKSEPPLPPVSNSNSSVLFFSDLSSGPNTGGENNKGAFVTIWGKNFGATQGSSYITVGGGQVASYPIWGENNANNSNLDMITFQLGSNAQTGDIVLHTSEGDSDGLPFVIREGKIFFTSKTDGNNSYNGLYSTYQGGTNGPWLDFTPFDNYAGMYGRVLNPGDIVYIKTGSYDHVSDDWDANLHIRPHHTGVEGNPIAIVGYPGDDPKIDGMGWARRGIMLRGGVTDWVVAKLKVVNNTGGAIAAGDNSRIRIIGNEIYNCPSYYGTIEFGHCHDCKVLGNHVYNSGKPDNKLAHLIYYGGNGTGSDIEIAWNLLHDEKGGRCIQIYGHSNEDHLTGLSIHDNFVFNCPYDGILVGGSDASVQDWIKDALIYNNIVYNVGWGGIRIANPGVHAKIFNNTIYNKNNGHSLYLQAADTLEIYNNIFAIGGSQSHIWYYFEDSINASIMNYNMYSGGSGKPSQDTGNSSSYVEDFKFVDKVNADFHLQKNSPAIDKGTSDVSSVVPRDYDANSRPQGSGYDIGAYER